MNPKQMRQFMVLAETLNFRRAAERLNMAQPPLSMSIKRLEVELGAALFLRERRGLRLTLVGESVLPHARLIAFHTEQLRTAAANASDGVGGQLRIGFVGSATYRLFPQALPEFRRRYPQVTLELREGTTTQILRQVERGDIDLGLIRHPVIESTGARLQPVEHDQLVAALPSHGAFGARKALRLSDLAVEPFVLYSSSAALNLRSQVILACGAAGFTPNIVQEAVQVQTLLSLVESGVGVALVPSVSQAFAPRGVVFRMLAGAGAELNTAIAVATDPNAESAAAARFRELLLARSRAADPGRPAIRPRAIKSRAV